MVFFQAFSFWMTCRGSHWFSQPRRMLHENLSFDPIHSPWGRKSETRMKPLACMPMAALFIHFLKRNQSFDSPSFLPLLFCSINVCYLLPFFFFFFLGSCSRACRILVLPPGLEPVPLTLKVRDLTTVLLRNFLFTPSLKIFIYLLIFSYAGSFVLISEHGL